MLYVTVEILVSYRIDLRGQLIVYTDASRSKFCTLKRHIIREYIFRKTLAKRKHCIAMILNLFFSENPKPAALIHEHVSTHLSSTSLYRFSPFGVIVIVIYSSTSITQTHHVIFELP